ncbi:DUF6292 family protein [Amycolatopsis acidiphila]|uniref:DUF6292 domain-containing protein n=1 Tax=Amycolatopsis acidiphila TaxID=715473 RepID=A0A558AC35_9PSEU|nr:DUF6292 family protein [Amycolatopsis acidiphila]TVT21830.1 hypothetical protein FNH06_15865 [Amycolatopsis acidiphila]UIJ61550.1 DUF6292 family protein [Amycolatopsis acidiphila]GHG59291.1 hypothetical protein GCM10017788_12590 [Amycolatopsis acidiphila]
MDRGVDKTHALSQGLAGYVRAVAGALNLPAEGTSFEISDTATAYLALRQVAGRPGEDLMLVWSEDSGWAVAVETAPTSVIAYFGEDALPEPPLVARFVREVLAGRRRTGRRPVFSTEGNRPALAERLLRYV